MGYTFKENCSDIRNTRVIDIIKNLKKNVAKVDVYDPLVDSKESFSKYNVKLIKRLKNNFYDVVLIAVSHNFFKKMGIKKIRKLCKKKNIVFDVKNIFSINETDMRLWNRIYQFQ